MKNTLGDLNNHLFAQLERLNDEEMNMETLEMETNRAKAITMLAGKVIDNAKMVLDAKKYMDDAMDAEKPLPKMLEG